ncbi:MAG: MOSC domain-containing protein [Pseudomonadota bacterium]
MTVTETVCRPKTRAELEAALPEILSAPKDDGRLDLIVVRPGRGVRTTPQSCRVSLAGGVEGDHWNHGAHVSLPDGGPHPDIQVCIMPSRVIRAIAGGIENWAPAGDNLFIDMDLTPVNVPPGTRLAIGSAELTITEQPHNGCQAFIDRYGRDACLFVNVGHGKVHRLRGIYARVSRDGSVSVGDRLRKIG